MSGAGRNRLDEWSPGGYVETSWLEMVPDFTPQRALGLAATAEHIPLLRRLCAHNRHSRGEARFVTQGPLRGPPETDKNGPSSD